MVKLIASSFLIFTLTLVLYECSANPPPIPAGIEIREISRNPGLERFSLESFQERLELIYPDRETLALKLTEFDLSGHDDKLIPGREKSVFLDRIGYCAEDFGRHFYLMAGGYQNLFYLDRFFEEEEMSRFKWIYRRDPDSEWGVDVLPPFEGSLIAVLPSGSGDPFPPCLYRVREDRLEAVMREGKESLMSGIRPAPLADTCMLVGDGLRGFTFFDKSTRRLLLVVQTAQGHQCLPLYPSGERHYARVDANGTLQVLLHNPQTYELIHLSSPPPYRRVEETRVTLARETGSLFLFEGEGGYRYLYDEALADTRQDRLHVLSLLIPAGKGYRKVRLLESPQPILRFRAQIHEGVLYVAFLDSSLKLLAVRLSSIGS